MTYLAQLYNIWGHENIFIQIPQKHGTRCVNDIQDNNKHDMEKSWIKLSSQVLHPDRGSYDEQQIKGLWIFPEAQWAGMGSLVKAKEVTSHLRWCNYVVEPCLRHFSGVNFYFYPVYCPWGRSMTSICRCEGDTPRISRGMQPRHRIGTKTSCDKRSNVVAF
jgi:hypothetical protein